MRQLNDTETKVIIGGAISGTLINAISKLINTVFDIGKTLGSALRRLISRSACSI